MSKKKKKQDDVGETLSYKYDNMGTKSEEDVSSDTKTVDELPTSTNNIVRVLDNVKVKGIKTVCVSGISEKFSIRKNEVKTISTTLYNELKGRSVIKKC